MVVVDDDPPHRHLISMLMEEQIADETSVVSLPSGTAALDHLEETRGRRTLVMSDYVMPEMSGLELLQEVLGRFEDEDLRFIAISSVQQAVDVDALRDAGAHEFIVKPYGLDEYVDMLRRVLTEWGGVELVPAESVA